MSGAWWCLGVALVSGGGPQSAKMSYMTWVAPLSHSCLGVRGKLDCLGVAVFSAVDSCVRCWPLRVVLALVSGVGPCVWSMLPTLARLSITGLDGVAWRRLALTLTSVWNLNGSGVWPRPRYLLRALSWI